MIEVKIDLDLSVGWTILYDVNTAATRGVTMEQLEMFQEYVIVSRDVSGVWYLGKAGEVTGTRKHAVRYDYQSASLLIAANKVFASWDVTTSARFERV